MKTPVVKNDPDKPARADERVAAGTPEGKYYPSPPPPTAYAFSESTVNIFSSAGLWLPDLLKTARGNAPDSFIRIPASAGRR